MAHQNPSEDEIRTLLTSARTIAVVGASSKENRPSHGVMRRLIDHGYQVIPVNPHEREVLGQRAYNTLAEVPEHIDIVDVFRRAEDTPEIADESVQAGAGAFWLQLGITNDDAAERAEAGGLTVVMDSCLAVVVSVLGIPRKD